jgi:hypothetical protein
LPVSLYIGVQQCDGLPSSPPEQAKKNPDASDDGSSHHGSPVQKKRKLSKSSKDLGEQLTNKKRTSATRPKSTDQLKKQVKKNKNEDGTKMSYCVEGVLSTWSETTDYGQSFRAMNEEGQRTEVDNLNKGAVKGMKGIIKNKLLIVHYKQLVADKMKQYLSDSKVSQESIFHAAPKAGSISIANLKFLSVGEWVEFDADRTPGFNSEGGIAVIVNVHDDLADVKYVLTRRVEKFVPLRRLN